MTTSDAFRELKRRSTFTNVAEKNTRYITRIFDAMAGTEQGSMMESCKAGGARCGSVYCDECRHRKQLSMLYRYKTYYKDKLDNNETLARDRLRWVSVLHNVVEINTKTQNDEIETIRNVERSVEMMKAEVAAIGKKYRDRGIWLRGGVHLEIVDYKAFRQAAEDGIATIKEKTLSSFISRMSNTDAEFIFLVHFHGLFDRGDMNDGELAKMFAERWNSALRQVDISTLWDKVNAIQHDSNGRALKDDNGKYVRKKESQQLKHAFIAMANYCFSFSNDKLQYARNWSQGQYTMEIDDEFDDNWNITRVATQIGPAAQSKRMSVGHIRLLVEASNAVNGNRHKGLDIRIDSKD